MKSNNDKKTGRTFFDLIVEYPKVSFVIFLLFFLATIILIILKIPVKVGNVEVGSKPILFDTIIKTKTDTKYIEKNPIIIKESTKDKNSYGNKIISLSQNDTIITVQNQPANINTGTNNGIIGNNNNVDVNVDEIQRILSQNSKKEILNLIFELIEENNIKDTCISVSSVLGNKEAYFFALEINSFLKSENLKSIGVGHFLSRDNPKGVNISYNNGKKPCIKINVGYR